MSELPRRKLEELTLLYENDPSRIDIFVEGSFDVSIFRWLIREGNKRNFAVYEISTIEIPDNKLMEGGKKVNNRERLVYLAEHFQNKINMSKQIFCFIDADFDYINNSILDLHCLVYTDYSCMEMYFYSENAFKKFLEIHCNRADWPVKTIMNSVNRILVEWFLMRFTNDRLRWEMDWLDNISCLEIKEFSLTLDKSGYVRKFLNKNSRIKQQELFSNSMENYRNDLKEDPKFQIHGHDFIDLLSWFLHKNGINKEIYNNVTLRRALVLATDASTLLNEKGIKKIFS